MVLSPVAKWKLNYTSLQMRHNTINMKKALIYWFGFLSILLWMSCAPKKTFTNNTTVKDSTFVKKTITPVDTIVKVPENKVSIEANVNEISETPIVNRSKNLTASLSKVGNTIIADCHEEELLLTIQLQKELIESYRNLETVISSEVKVPEKYIPEYVKPLIWIGALSLILLIISICIYFYKK